MIAALLRWVVLIITCARSTRTPRNRASRTKKIPAQWSLFGVNHSIPTVQRRRRKSKLPVLIRAMLLRMAPSPQEKLLVLRTACAVQWCSSNSNSYCCWVWRSWILWSGVTYYHGPRHRRMCWLNFVALTDSCDAEAGASSKFGVMVEAPLSTRVCTTTNRMRTTTTRIIVECCCGVVLMLVWPTTITRVLTKRFLLIGIVHDENYLLILVILWLVLLNGTMRKRPYWNLILSKHVSNSGARKDTAGQNRSMTVLKVINRVSRSVSNRQSILAVWVGNSKMNRPICAGSPVG